MSASDDFRAALAQLASLIADAILLIQQLHQNQLPVPAGQPSMRVNADDDGVPESEVQAMVSRLHDMHANLSGVVKAGRANIAGPPIVMRPVDEKPADEPKKK